MTPDALGMWITNAYLLSVPPLGLAGSCTLALTRRSASLRHHVWVVALAVALVAPVAQGVVPRLNVPLLGPGELVRLRLMRETLAEAAWRESIGEVATPSPQGWSANASLALVWLIGAVPLLCVRALRRIRLSRLVAHSSGLDARAGVRSHARVSVPMLAGLWPPTILLPMSAAEWPVDAREAVLAHERAHVQRQDHVTALISEVATTVYWLNPLAWMAATALEREREAACDEEVLRTGIKPSVYAAALLIVSRTMPVRRTPSSLSMVGGRLDARIRRVLRLAPNSGRVPLSWPPTIFLIAFCAVALAGVHVVARAPNQTIFEAPDPFVATWTLNLSQSTLIPVVPGMAPTEEVLKIQRIRGRYEATATRTTENGSVFVLRYSAPVNGGSVSYSDELAPLASVAMKKINDRALDLISTLFGTAIQTEHFTVSGDGKTLRNNIQGVTAQGKLVQGLELWNKQ